MVSTLGPSPVSLARSESYPSLSLWPFLGDPSVGVSGMTFPETLTEGRPSLPAAGIIPWPEDPDLNQKQKIEKENLVLAFVSLCFLIGDTVLYPFRLSHSHAILAMVDCM